MKRKKGRAASKRARCIVSLNQKTQETLAYYCIACGWEPAKAVARMVELGDAAFRKLTASVDAQRAVILADQALEEIERGNAKRIQAVKRHRAKKADEAKQAKGEVHG